MALTAASRLQNLHKSLNAYFFTTLVTADSLQVHFPNQREVFVPSGARWVQIDYILGLARTFMGPVTDAGNLGNVVEGIINCNCCELVAQRTDRYALAAVQDAVHNRVTEGTSIPIRDYDTGGTPTVGYFVLLSVTEQQVQDGFGPNQAGIAIWNISARGEYIEAF